MFEFKILKLLVQSLMLANFAGVVFSFNNRHATGDARRKMCTTVSTRDIKLVAWLSTLRAAEFLLALVNRRMSGEQIDGQQLISSSLDRSDCVKSLELDKSSAAFSKTAIEEGCNGHQTVDILRLKFLFVF